MDIISALKEAGFSQVVALDGAECDYPEYDTILLAIWPYTAEVDTSAINGVRIHPYYFASQQAYVAAAAIAKTYAADGVALRDDIRVKPIFSRLPGFSQGRNTLSYTKTFGSRFHVQIFTMTPGIQATCHLEEEHDLHCGNCMKCVEACPTNALEGGAFHRERCLRNWQMSGQPIPEHLRGAMGNRLIGCDVCQQVCTHNPAAEGTCHLAVDLETLLRSPKEAAAALRPQIGVNLSIANRVLSQACLIAGCSEQTELLPMLEKLQEHASPAVSAHAAWAVSELKMKHM